MTSLCAPLLQHFALAGSAGSNVQSPTWPFRFHARKMLRDGIGRAFNLQSLDVILLLAVGGGEVALRA
jgi:hypothetical protein